MRIVVDTNIVFSAILNTNSKIARILLQPRAKNHFYSTEQLIIEIEKHKGKLKAFTSYTDSELDKMIRLITNKIRFINVKLIPLNIYAVAENLTEDVDIDDTEFVALTEHLKGKLWSGDKELILGLKSKKWMKFIGTDELFKDL